MIRSLRVLLVAGAMVGLVAVHQPAEAAPPMPSRIVVETEGDHIPDQVVPSVDDRLRKTLESARSMNGKPWGCVKQPGAPGSASRAGEVLITATVIWEPGALDRVTGVFGSRSGVYRVRVEVDVPVDGEVLRVADGTVEQAASERETTILLAGKAADLLGVLLGQGSPCEEYLLKGTVKHRAGNASYQQTQDGVVTASIKVLRSADAYLAANPARTPAEEEETRRFFTESRAKGEFLVQGEGTIAVVATHTPTDANCQGTRTEKTVPVIVYGTLKGATLELQVTATAGITLEQTCFGVRCPPMDQGIICPGGAQTPAQGTSDTQLPMLSTLFAGDGVVVTTQGSGPSTLQFSDSDSSQTWELEIVVNEDEPAVAVS